MRACGRNAKLVIISQLTVIKGHPRAFRHLLETDSHLQPATLTRHIRAKGEGSGSHFSTAIHWNEFNKYLGSCLYNCEKKLIMKWTVPCTTARLNSDQIVFWETSFWDMTGKKTVFITPTGIITYVLLHLCLGSGVQLLFYTIYEWFFIFLMGKGKKSCAEVSFFCFVFFFLCFRNIENCFGYFRKYNLCRWQQRPQIVSLLYSLQSFGTVEIKTEQRLQYESVLNGRGHVQPSTAGC